MSSIEQRRVRHVRLRKKVSGTSERPRLSINFSGSHIRVQVIDDGTQATLVSVQTTEKDLASDKSVRANVVTASRIGKLIAERALSKKIKRVVFDRGGFKYHGKVKALADAARETGLEF
ncbi:MAG: 50S ribosomal protein L18 [Chthoniobacterales bacterium]